MKLIMSVQRPSSDSDTAALLREWLTGTFETLGGDLRQRLLEAGPLPEGSFKSRQPIGEPGDIWAYVASTTRTARGVRNTGKEYSEATWQKFLGGLAKKVPASGTLGLCTIDQFGTPNGGRPKMTIQYDIDEHDEGWLHLAFLFDPALLEDPAWQQALLTHARRFADEHGPTYAEVSYWSGYSNQSALEYRFKVTEQLPIARSRSTLRGYAWVTVCPQEAGDRLGGLEALQASGAFSTAEPLQAGGYWLQATPSYADYDMTAGTKVFTTLAPALRPGTPRPPAPHEPAEKIILRDAAEISA